MKRGSPLKGSPLGVKTSQTTRAVDSSISQGIGMKVSRSGHEVHIALGDAGEAFDRAAIEPDTVLDGAVPQLDRDRNLFDDAHDIAELQAHKTHIMAFDRIVDPSSASISLSSVNASNSMLAFPFQIVFSFQFSVGSSRSLKTRD